MTTANEDIIKRWVERQKAKPDGERDDLRIVAVSMTDDAIEAAIAIGLSRFPPDKFTPTHAIEIARLIFDHEMSLRAPDDGDPDTRP